MTEKNRDYDLGISSSSSSSARDRSRSPPGRRDKKEEKPLENNISNARKRLKGVGIQMKLAPLKKATNKPKLTVASAFNVESDEEPEEMPREARMKMRNIGRETPTSSGPNSFGKTRQGFSDSKKMFEKTLREAMENTEDK